MLREVNWLDVAYLVAAARWTLLLTLIAFIGGGLIGLLVAVLRVTPSLAARAVAFVYVQAIQGTPLLALLFVFYFGLSIVGIEVSAWVAATIAYSIYGGAFLGEIWRGCLQSIPRTQWEASASLGLGFSQQLRWIIVPQAVRIALPPTVGFLVQLVKNTSLAAVIGFVELTREGQITTNATFQPLLVYSIVAAIYFCICFPMSRLAQHLERKLDVAR